MTVLLVSGWLTGCSTESSPPTEALTPDTSVVASVARPADDTTPIAELKDLQAQENTPSTDTVCALINTDEITAAFGFTATVTPLSFEPLTPGCEYTQHEGARKSSVKVTVCCSGADEALFKIAGPGGSDTAVKVAVGDDAYAFLEPQTNAAKVHVLAKSQLIIFTLEGVGPVNASGNKVPGQAELDALVTLTRSAITRLP